ncbi:GAF and ANTAR domain-containing protein [Nocardioides litoris]|uniref:GAF and ANTAR domain-containing protein n=1 Tax=Nocardioides litoris TaxID=1926648 RepID=UPI00111E7DED|nr:GAF and ANTAR domain-containing protein [Nocardioides litoris]
MDLPESSAAFAAIAAELHAESAEGPTARTVVHRLADLLVDAEEVSLTVRGREGHRTLAATGEVAEQADAAQYALGQGPCLAAAEGASWIRSGDVRSDPRWPRWGAAAAELGVRSLLSVQLLASDGTSPVGALNLYCRETGGFADPDAIDVAVIYAMHAASALNSARLVTNLQTALGTRHTIGLAQGIVMERYGLDEQQSFELLRRLSSTTETKLRDVASGIVETRALPEH